MVWAMVESEVLHYDDGWLYETAVSSWSCWRSGWRWLCGILSGTPGLHYLRRNNWACSRECKGSEESVVGSSNGRRDCYCTIQLAGIIFWIVLLACIIRRILYSCNLFIKCVVVMAYEQDWRLCPIWLYWTQYSLDMGIENWTKGDRVCSQLN